MSTAVPEHSSFASMTLSEKVHKVLQSASRPLSLKDIRTQLKSMGVPVTGKAKVSDADIQQILEAEGVYAHPAGKGKPKYWHKRPLTTAELMEATFQAKLAALGDEAVPVSKLGKPTKAASAEAHAAFEAILAKLVADGTLHQVGKNYTKKKPPSVAELMEVTVQAKLSALGDEAVAAKDLGKPSGKSGTPEKLAAFDAILTKLLNEGKLYKVGEKYTKKKPPVVPWHESPAHKAEFTKLKTSAMKLLKSGVVTLDQIITALRETIGGVPPTLPPVTPAVNVIPPVVQPPPVTPTEVRQVVREAYDHLCLFVEFRDKLVELPRLYHEAKKRLPSLSVEAFHEELTDLSNNFKIELHVLNEVITAVEPHLAINQAGRLYYYARWK